MKRRLVAVAILISLVSWPAFGWEVDLHYGLSKWLAYKAGFSLNDAETIAIGVQSRDDGSLYPAPGTVFFRTCLQRDVDYSRLVQTYHFASFGNVPGAPPQRAVAPGLTDNAATELVWKEIRNSIANEPPAIALRNLGISLHPLEDSWSHQGTPDMPPRPCSQELAWGHPADRGGYRSKKADQTYLHVEDAVATARRTYELLQEFLKTHPTLKSHAEARWVDLESAVRSFAQASSKEEKAKWFESQPDVPITSYTRKDFLKDISIPDSRKKNLSTRINELFAKQAPEKATMQMHVLEKWSSGQVNVAVDHLLDSWIVQKNIDALAPVMSFAHVARGLVGEGYDTHQDVNLTKVAFGMWLIRDQGVAEELDHGISPKAERWSAKDLEVPMYELERQPLIEVGKLREAIHALQSTAPYTLIPLSPRELIPLSEVTEEPKDFIVAFQFFHAPHDVILLYVQRDPDHRWTIQNINWFAF